jgi:hypothetical protein
MKSTRRRPVLGTLADLLPDFLSDFLSDFPSHHDLGRVASSDVAA